MEQHLLQMKPLFWVALQATSNEMATFCAENVWLLPTTSHLLCKLGKIPAISIRPSFIKSLSFLLCRNDILTIWEAWLEPDIDIHQIDDAAVWVKAGDHVKQQHHQRLYCCLLPLVLALQNLEENLELSLKERVCHIWNFVLPLCFLTLVWLKFH